MFPQDTLANPSRPNTTPLVLLLSSHVTTERVMADNILQQLR